MTIVAPASNSASTRSTSAVPENEIGRHGRSTV
jgi:hypothetical protein